MTSSPYDFDSNGNKILNLNHFQNKNGNITIAKARLALHLAGCKVRQLYKDEHEIYFNGFGRLKNSKNTEFMYFMDTIGKKHIVKEDTMRLKGALLCMAADAWLRDQQAKFDIAKIEKEFAKPKPIKVNRINAFSNRLCG